MDVASALDVLERGVVDRCIVGAIDSAVDPNTLDILHRLGLLQTPTKPVGFFPGEAAAFILIERVDSAHQRRARIEGHLGMPAITAAGNHRFAGPSVSGLALSTAVLQCLTNSGQSAADLIIVNLNGEELRANEFGDALVRLKAAKLAFPSQSWYPALHFGEIGAASAAASICLAIRGFVRGYVPGNTALVMLTDDEATRGAFLVKAPMSA